MRQNPERLAWIVLLAAFAVCVGLAVGVPLGVRWLVFNLTRPLPVVTEVTQGTLLVQPPLGQLQSVSAPGRPNEVREGTVLTTTRENGEAVLEILNPLVPTTTLSQIVLYPDSQLSLITLRTPRYSLSPNAHHLQFRLDRGRARITIFPSARSIDARVSTPQTQVVLLEAGRYSLEVMNSGSQGDVTQISFLEGKAKVVWTPEYSLVLQKEKRTLVDSNGVVAVQPAERNLIRNGNFTEPLSSSTWISYTQTLDPQEDAGRAEVVNLGGRSVVRFSRQGGNHAETGVIQTIDNGDVRGFATLRLHLSVELFFQDVPVCGSLGSECPIMVELKYKDEQGTDRSWFQGFYYLASNGSDPAYCVQCSGVQTGHRQVPQAVAVPYDSDNLMQVLTQGGIPRPARILSLRIYASGHSFETAVGEVELLAQE